MELEIGNRICKYNIPTHTQPSLENLVLQANCHIQLKVITQIK